MKRRNTEQFQVQVGAFLAIGILLTMMLVFVLSSRSNYFQEQYSLVCYFQDISGLRVGAPVQLAGINVGVVEEIAFEENLAKTSVKLLLKINKDYQKRIRADSYATVATQGLLGDRLVFVTVGSEKMAMLGDGAMIEAQNPTGFTQLVENGDKLMVDAKKFIKNLNTLTTNVNDVVGEIKRGKGLLHAIVFDKGGTETLQEVDEFARNINAMSRNLSAITGKVNSGKGTLGALINDPTLFNDLKTLLGKANRNKLIRAVVRYTLQTKEKDQLP
jgi:phospholipid/cholesterol/gamma-HCH transport system substrate-binding protein